MKTFLKVVAILCCVSTGCSKPDAGTNTSAADGRLNVVCTTNIVCDLVTQIGGERLVVSAIMDGPGIDPHTYTPSPTDTNKLTAADVVVYSGLHLEGQMDEALESLRLRGIPVICVTDRLTNDFPDRLLTTAEGLADPHVWFDPELWAECGQSVADQLAKVDTEGTADFANNADTFRISMMKLKEDGLKELQQVAKDRRVLVTAHDAFEYFARCFQFEVQAVQGISTESEPGLKRINNLVNRLVKQKIAAVFTEQSVSDRNIQALISGCESRQHEIKIGGKLYSDTIGIRGGPEGTLQTGLMYNIRQIVDGLANDSSEAGN
ncbi:MAG: zinc ABC transporter substrate-binding protein [Fuerstiella sp.]